MQILEGATTDPDWNDVNVGKYTRAVVMATLKDIAEQPHESDGTRRLRYLLFMLEEASKP